MASNLSRSRLSKAFNEGRRAALENVENPYDNPTLRALWDRGRAQQRAGELTTPIPPLEHGERRAQKTPHNPPAPKTRSTSLPRNPPRRPGPHRGRR